MFARYDHITAMYSSAPITAPITHAKPLRPVSAGTQTAAIEKIAAMPIAISARTFQPRW